MTALHFSDAVLYIDRERGLAASLTVGKTDLLAAKSALFTFRVRTPDAETADFCSAQGVLYKEESCGTALELTYNGFAGAAKDVTVILTLDICCSALQANISVKNTGGNMIEWVDVLPLILPKLRGEGGPLNGEILYPYNEGALVDSSEMRQNSIFPSAEPEYPSHGSYPVFPNMVFAQMMAYLYDGNKGRQILYFGAHDAARGVKKIDFTPAPITMTLFASGLLRKLFLFPRSNKIKR